MGLFSSKAKTYVSSVAYPLGEDGEGKVEFLKSTVLNATLQNRPVGETIANAYLGGQGMSLRNAFRYARDHYANGIPNGAGQYVDSPNHQAILAVLQQLNPTVTYFDMASTVVATADFVWWAEQWLEKEYLWDRDTGIMHRAPAGVDANAAISFDLEDDGTIDVLFMNTDNTSRMETFRPKSYKKMGVFVHCAFRPAQEFAPSITTSTRASEPGDEDGTTQTTTRVTKEGNHHDTIVKTMMTVAGGQTTIKVSTQIVITRRTKFFLYELGTSVYPTLDDMLTSSIAAAPYYPAVPLRINNVDVTDEAHQDTALYKTSKKLLKKVGMDLDQIAEQVNDNEQIKEIDYAFVVFGVALKTESQEGKRYLYRFFQHLRNISVYESADMGGWINDYTNISFQEDLGGGLPAGVSTQGYTNPGSNVLRVFTSSKREDNHNIKIQWQYIDTTQKTGTVFVGAKPGDVAIVSAANREEYDLGTEMKVDNSRLYARRQLDIDTYEELEIAGLYYENFVYQGKAVSISAYDAMTKEDEEGFIIPLNQQIIRNTPIVELTDLSYQCMHVVFNCYQVVKKKWYQTGWFKILLVIVAIVITVMTWGAAGPMAAGTLASMSGAAAMTILGVTTMTLLATYLAATIYVLAMVVLTSIITKGATKLFGEKWGAVIAVVVMVLAMNWANTGNIIGATAGTTGSQLTAQTLLRATGAVLNAYGAYTQGQMAGVLKDMTKLEDAYKDKMKELEELTQEMLGTNLHLIDIQGLTDATAVHLESPQVFLDRTLMLGSDIAEITEKMVTNFAEFGLRLPTTG